MNTKVAIVVAISVGLLLAGQAIAYYVPASGFGIDTDVDGSRIKYTVRSGFDSQYNEVHLSNPYNTPVRYYVLVDSSYPWMSDPSSVEPTYYFLQKEFAKSSSFSIEPATSEKISQMMSDSLSSGTFDTGLIAGTGSLPDTVYDGTASSLIVQWMNAGGTMYWAGGEFGRYISSQNGITEVPDYYDSVSLALFGSSHLFNESGETTFGNVRISEELTTLSGAYFADTTYGVNMSKLSAPHLYLGYTDGTHASITIMKYGCGQLTMFGNYATFQNSSYLAHVVMMKYTHSTELVSYKTGSINHKTFSSSFNDSPGITHIIVVHNLKWSASWIYDPAQQKFV